MPKKKSSSSSLKNPSQEVDRPGIQQNKPVPKPGKLGIEIDEIFSGRMKKKLSQEVEKPAIQPTKPVPRPGKLGIEIDEIFGGRKKKKIPELEKPESKEEVAKKERKRKRNELDGFNNNPKSRPRKRTKDGLPVFTEDELGINKAYAGDTPLCPFDCNCCF
ncbi:uncharacterized protein C6G9.01c [Eutrema salsugineum]|uniref:uncharacterized protein C6G9.01c n=1 Tax=Eutrema salsugineum TaxID=72664 RepID=UPI000CED49C4|nr:uncharacterized protein C6G9.01c [Eutrema salsugineum]XP_024012182.1 uncharacterized protein C6G9.01c [Eutrema salsugineum]